MIESPAQTAGCCFSFTIIPSTSAILSKKSRTCPTTPPSVPEEDRLFVTHAGLSNAEVDGIESVVYVDPRAYDRLDSVEKNHQVGCAIGQLNKHLAGKRYALMGPGRWGAVTSTSACA